MSLLNRLDLELERILREADAALFMCDQKRPLLLTTSIPLDKLEEDTYALKLILAFSSMLLKNAHGKDIYASTEVIFDS